MEKIVSFMGAFLKHIIGVLVLCWRRMLRAALIGFGIGVVLVLLVAVISTGQAYPGALALAVALIFGAALAYCVAMTVFIEEFLLGVVDLIRLLEGDAKAVAHITATVAEREVGDVGHGLRRLIGLPAPTRPTPPAPTLPELPRYPAAPARPAPRQQSLAGSVAGRVVSGAVRDAALAGGAALASAVVARVVAPHPQPAPIPTPAPAAPAAASPAEKDEPTTEPTNDAQAPTGEPVRADRLPRIGWTYEHEAVRPTRSMPPPDTLAELAGETAVASAASAMSTAPSEPTEPEPLDVAVVAPTPPSADEATTAPADLPEDPAPLDDERLAEPLALTLPEEASAEADAVPAPTESAPASSSEAPPLDPAMLVPAPATTPLAADEPPSLDPAMLTPAPSTTPLRPEDAPEDAAEDAPLDPDMLTPAPATTPLVAAPDAPVEESSDSSMLESAPVAEAAPASAAPTEPVEEPTLAVTPDATSDATLEPASGVAPVDAPAETIPPARSAFARVTRPVAGLLDSALDTINHVNVNTGPRVSAPESGLWERLSQALIDRAGGAPSSPFAAPQARPSAPDAPDAPDPSDSTDGPEADGTPQA